MAEPAFQTPDEETVFAPGPHGQPFFRIEDFGCGEGEPVDEPDKQGVTVSTQSLTGGG